MNIKVKINGMSCGHCSMAVTKALKTIDGVEEVEVSLEDKIATIISSKEIDENVIKEIIEEEGYEFSGIL